MSFVIPGTIKNPEAWAKRHLARRAIHRSKPVYPVLLPGQKALGVRRDPLAPPVHFQRPAHVPVSRNKYNP